MESELLISSNIKITAEDWALTPLSVKHVLLQVLERVAPLEEKVSRMRLENERLREQTQRSSRNSSQPPSSDAPSAQPRNKRHLSGRKPSDQPGHEGHQRKLYPPEECRSVNDHRPTRCGVCATALSGDDPNPLRHQVVELPEVKPLVDEHRLHQLSCPNCSEVTRARFPFNVTASGYGPRLAAVVGLLSGAYRQSERQTQRALSDFFRIEVALGTINNLRQEVSEAISEPVAKVTEFARAQEVANADETGWAQGNSDSLNPARHKA